jgi:hypothetical protein
VLARSCASSGQLLVEGLRHRASKRLQRKQPREGQIEATSDPLVIPFQDHQVLEFSSMPIQSINLISLSGSSTPFWSLLWSKPFSLVATTEIFTVSAWLARLAIAFQAV